MELFREKTLHPFKLVSYVLATHKPLFLYQLQFIFKPWISPFGHILPCLLNGFYFASSSFLILLLLLFFLGSVIPHLFFLILLFLHFSFIIDDDVVLGRTDLQSLGLLPEQEGHEQTERSKIHRFHCRTSD